MYNKDPFTQRKYKPLKVLFFVGLFLLLAAGFSALVMLLWNAILPEVTGVKPLTFWQAAGLLLLAKILFGGFRRPGGARRRATRAAWKSKWIAMSQEERQEAKARWEAHCRKREDGKEKN